MKMMLSQLLIGLNAINKSHGGRFGALLQKNQFSGFFLDDWHEGDGHCSRRFGARCKSAPAALPYERSDHRIPSGTTVKGVRTRDQNSVDATPLAGGKQPKGTAQRPQQRRHLCKLDDHRS